MYASILAHRRLGSLFLALVLLVKTCLRVPCNAVFGVMTGRSVRYFLMVIVGGVLWPTTFKWFSGLGRKE